MQMSDAAREGLLRFIKSLESEFVGMVPALLWVEDRDPKGSRDPGPMLGVYRPEKFKHVTHQDCFIVGEYKVYVCFWPKFYEAHKDWTIDIVNGDLGLVPTRK